MKRNRSVILVFLALILGIVISYRLFLQDRLHLYLQEKRAMEMMDRLGAGINIGNDLDVYGVSQYKDNPSVTDYETFWNNVPATQELFSCIYGAGFRSVRIPVTWSDHLDAQGRIDPEFMDRVTEVVNMALKEKLYVILDTHHENFILPTYAGEKESTEKLVGLWQQIAENFASYDERLMFEGMNEPRYIGSDEEWTDGNEELRTVVNHMNRAFVETVRKSGGNNDTRYCLIGAYATSSKKHALENLDPIEEDKHIIISVHAYLPRKFIDNEKGKETFKEHEESYTGDIIELKESLQKYFLGKRIPVVITEYGCQEKEDEEQRIAWAEYFVGTFADIGVPTMWWDDGSDYKIIDRERCTSSKPKLVTTIVRYYLNK
ncbi:MAG: glycoside hydrolase family 5 protein [Butyrivibrio sp.]|nr:glycoside hydrolase family 5 protein [Butyrivibrio sp.]